MGTMKVHTRKGRQIKGDIEELRLRQEGQGHTGHRAGARQRPRGLEFLDQQGRG